MRSLKILIIITTLMIFPLKENFAQLDYGFKFSKAGTSGLQFLKIGIGARETAMGEAVTSLVNDVNAVFWNPSGIAYVENYELTFSHKNWFAGSNHNSAAFAFPVGSFVFAISTSALQIQKFEETTALSPEGTGRMVSAGDYVFGLAAAKRFTDRLSIGLQLKYVHEKLDDYSINNFLFDVGTIYVTGFRDLTLGFSLQHFGPDMRLLNQDFRTPLLFRIGASDKLKINEDFIITGAAELVHPTDNNEWVNLGLEFNLLKLLSLRGGHRINVDEGKWSAGVGINPPEFAGVAMNIDYAFVLSEKVFDNIHRISIKIGLK
ncbi:MAG TPA: PorV/PorQ family protein [Ignavibacteriaceae bacterium]|nr:PorV/PorQ family protein [Ignavibacteriaceae bacterium]